MVSRKSDGHPLCANTDSPSVDQHSNLHEAYKQMKLFSRIGGRFPDRCSFLMEDFAVHFISALGIIYLVVCDSTYPTVLAFSYLDEIQKDFLLNFEKQKINSSSRPYDLIEFDITLQKVKQRYNNPRSLTTRLNLADLSQELKLRPPYIISPEDLRPSGSSTDGAKTYSSSATFRRYGRYIPADPLVLISISLNCFCAFLNLTRGLSVINDAHIENFDTDHYQYAAAFFICCALSLYQVYLMCYPLKKRKALACATVASICICQLYLWEYRNNYQIVFHIIVACLGTFVIFTRKVQEKLPQYTL